jgi:intein/homing endonuclease
MDGKPSLLTVYEHFQRSFGIEIKRKERKHLPTFAPPENNDGAIFTRYSGGLFYSTVLDLSKSASAYSNEVALIDKYRELEAFAEVENAIDEIINELVVVDEENNPVQLVLDQVNLKESTKKAIQEEWDGVLKLFHFKKSGYDIAKRFYVDGRIYYHLMVDPNNTQLGIQEVRYIDPRMIKKVIEPKMPKTEAEKAQVQKLIDARQYVQPEYDEYFYYNESGINNMTASGLKVAPDSVAYAHSGLLDHKTGIVYSHLHKALKPFNLLRMLEDAFIIYKLCLVGDTRVKTPGGYKFIKDILEGDVVFSTDGHELIPTLVTKSWKTGTKPVFSVKSTHFSVTGSDNHPILVFDNQTNVVEYIEIKDIKPKQHSFVYIKPVDTGFYPEMPMPREMAVKITNPKELSPLRRAYGEILHLKEKTGVALNQVRNFLYGLQYLKESKAFPILQELGCPNVKLEAKYAGKHTNDVNLPSHITPEFARLFGFMIGDGSVSQYGLSFAEGTNADTNRFYANLLITYFGNCRRYHSTDESRKYLNWNTSSTLGAEVFVKLGFVSGAKNKRVPEWVFHSADSIKEAFVLGYCDADAHIRGPLFQKEWAADLACSNKSLIEDIKELWTGLGYSSGHIRERQRQGGFRTSLGRSMPDTTSYELHISKTLLKKFERITGVENAGEEDVYDLEVEHEKHNFIANGIAVHNSRAPERRIFYIDVSNLPPAVAEKYLQTVAERYKNKVAYDATTGEVTNERMHMTMLQDFFLAQREGKGTQIDTLGGGGSDFTDMNQVDYHLKKLYRALNIPISRIEDSGPFNMGRPSEITRDEVKFNKFIRRLRNRFVVLLEKTLEIQLVLKQIMSREEFIAIREDIRYDFLQDNLFTELKNIDMWTGRVSLLAAVQPYTTMVGGGYFSRAWVKRNLLMMTEEEVEQIEKEVEEETLDDQQKGIDPNGAAVAGAGAAPAVPTLNGPGSSYQDLIGHREYPDEDFLRDDDEPGSSGDARHALSEVFSSDRLGRRLSFAEEHEYPRKPGHGRARRS